MLTTLLQSSLYINQNGKNIELEERLASTQDILSKEVPHSNWLEERWKTHNKILTNFLHNFETCSDRQRFIYSDVHTEEAKIDPEHEKESLVQITQESLEIIKSFIKCLRQKTPKEEEFEAIRTQNNDYGFEIAKAKLEIKSKEEIILSANSVMERLDFEKEELKNMCQELKETSSRQKAEIKGLRKEIYDLRNKSVAHQEVQCHIIKEEDASVSKTSAKIGSCGTSISNKGFSLQSKMKKKMFTKLQKNMAKFRAAVKMITILGSDPKTINKPKEDPDDPRQIYSRIKEMKESQMKGKKSFKSMEVRGAKKLLELVANFLQGVSANTEFNISVSKLFYDFVNK